MENIKCGANVKDLEIGDLVSAESHIVCGKCEFCLRGEGHICENTKVIGVDTQGCFANYIKLPPKIVINYLRVLIPSSFNS